VTIRNSSSSSRMHHLRGSSKVMLWLGSGIGRSSSSSSSHSSCAPPFHPNSTATYYQTPGLPTTAAASSRAPATLQALLLLLLLLEPHLQAGSVISRLVLLAMPLSHLGTGRSWTALLYPPQPAVHHHQQQQQQRHSMGRQLLAGLP
jgi:hypothetical protein